jgi:hypothetical protein
MEKKVTAEKKDEIKKYFDNALEKKIDFSCDDVAKHFDISVSTLRHNFPEECYKLTDLLLKKNLQKKDVSH